MALPAVIDRFPGSCCLQDTGMNLWPCARYITVLARFYCVYNLLTCLPAFA